MAAVTYYKDTSLYLLLCLPSALSERVRKVTKSEEETYCEYIFELRKPFIVYGIP